MRFWNRSSETLAQLFHGVPIHSMALLADRISEIFAGNISEMISKMRLEEYNEGKALLKETINELTSLLRSELDKWTSWKKADVARQLPGLITATQWKLGIKGYKYTLEATAGLAGAGMDVLPALKEILASFRNDKQESQAKKLALKYLQSPADYNEVTERALRCVITHLRNPENFRQTIFAWNHQQQLKLKLAVIERYLYEQLALFAYMAKGDRNALPVREIEIRLKRYIENRIGSEEKDQIASDIMQNTFLTFLDNRQTYQQKSFYVDKALHSYFTDIVRDKKEIRKYHKEKARRNRDASPDDFPEAERDEGLAEVIRILRQCLKLQDHKCRQLIHKRFFGDYADTLSYEAVAFLLNKPVRTIENRGPVCNGRLKSCVMNKSNQLGLRPF